MKLVLAIALAAVPLASGELLKHVRERFILLQDHPFIADRAGSEKEDPQFTVEAATKALESLPEVPTTPDRNIFAPIHRALIRVHAGVYDEKKVRAELEHILKTNDVVFFSWGACPASMKTRYYLKQAGASFKEFELDEMEEGGLPLRRELSKYLGRTTIPAVFVHGRYIGGCHDGPLGAGVHKLHKEGKLHKLVNLARMSPPAEPDDIAFPG
mmetsp:Transcript_17097/g.46234  ORF Transcript_17097/g.46234 Transcript_17097/m.46234 type:complete len:213 (+) Transcript_17097:27-665(+)